MVEERKKDQRPTCGVWRSIGTNQSSGRELTARWELMKEWLEKEVDHWNQEEEYRCYLFWAEGVDQLMTGGPVQAATSGSAAGSRYSGDPSFLTFRDAFFSFYAGVLSFFLLSNVYYCFE